MVAATHMNWNRIEANWGQFKGNVKKEWDALTDQQIDMIAGKRDQLAGTLQETYGLSKAVAEEEIAVWQENQSERQ